MVGKGPHTGSLNQEVCGFGRPANLHADPRKRREAHRRSRPRLRACRYLLDAPALLWKRDPPPLPFCASPVQISLTSQLEAKVLNSETQKSALVSNGNILKHVQLH